MDRATSKLLQNLGVMVQLSCIWEATARKPGNVHRFADFQNLHYLDFLASAAAIGPVLEKAWYRPVGEIVLEAVRATRYVSATNANLGIILLLTPLATVVPGRSLREELPRILRELTVADATLVYEAIRLAEPGGMGKVPDQDLSAVPTVTLREAMVLAENRDRIALQYAHDFRDVFELGVPTLAKELSVGADLEVAILATQLAFLAEFPDSLIERKHGLAVAEKVRNEAKAILAVGGVQTSEGRHAIQTFDARLRAERQNPGTSADLVAASLFTALRESIITLPFQGRWAS